MTSKGWYRSGENETSWTGTYPYGTLGDGTIGIDLVRPIYNSAGARIGVGDVSISIGSLGRNLQDLIDDSDGLVYVVELPTLGLIAASSSDVQIVNTTVGAQIIASESSDSRVSLSASFLDSVNFPSKFVYVLNGFFIQSRTHSDSYGLDWRIITVQEVDCHSGYTVGADNQTWWVSLNHLRRVSLM